MFAPTARKQSQSATDSSTRKMQERGYVRFDACSLHPHNRAWPLEATEPVGEFWATRDKHVFMLDGRPQPCKSSPLATLDHIWQTFPGYAVGWLSYEFGAELLGVAVRTELDRTPTAHFYLYDDVIFPPDPFPPSEQGSYEQHHKTGCGRAHPTILPAVSRDTYLRHVESIQRHIRDGDIYQANYTTRFQVTSNRKPGEVYERLLTTSVPPFAAFLNFGDYCIVSASPELLLATNGESVVTSPIKGTIAGKVDPSLDNLQADMLFNSAKDRAELLMIVDLARNDLGKVARIGTVATDTQPRLEKHGQIHHLVQDITARTSSEVTVANLLEALLPGGSISGVPKRRAVELLSEHEPTERGVYTGSIGYVHRQQAIFNLAIRTLTFAGGVYDVHAGGAITEGSSPAGEYEEMRLKSAPLFAALGIGPQEIPV